MNYLKTVMYHICTEIHFLHGIKLIHNDLKLDNIMFVDATIHEIDGVCENRENL